MVDLLTPILLGFIGGVTPGPIIFLAFSEVLKDSNKGLIHGGMYLIFAGLTEFFIGLFLIITSKSFQLPPIVFHTLAIAGISLLIYIAVKIFSINSISPKKQSRSISGKHIIAIMLVNGPLWMFWVSVCLPAAFNLGQSITYGEYLFLVLFEISMMSGLAIMLFGFNAFRNYFSNEKNVRRIFQILTGLLVLIIIKMIYSESIFFYVYLKNGF
ncbi:MAG: hypothetical protein KOO66_06355 [Bacteroidales bacterium]|nr:hypothetical protein [Bacteroidales bacterium]